MGERNWFTSNIANYCVDGSEILRSQVEVGSWSPIIYRGFGGTIQTVVGDRISEPSTSILWCFGYVGIPFVARWKPPPGGQAGAGLPA